jgi:hypothetical protein
MRSNKYAMWHDAIIARARTRRLDTDFERHHILPRSLGGSDDHDNIVCLTYREHFLVHWLLTKLMSGAARKKMEFALCRMTTRLRAANWQYEIVAEIRRTVRVGAKLSPTHIEALRRANSRPKTREHVEAVRKALTGLRRSEEVKERMRNIPKTPEWRANIAASLVGHVRTKESREKQSLAMKGWPKSLETRQRMADAAHKREMNKRNGLPAPQSRPSRLISPRL